ncbi:Scp-like extracellular protein [Globisporangium polare]
MKTSSVLMIAAACAATATTTSAQEFTNAEKALWIDRHNYFRMTALPFAAANMLKMKWSDDLAGQAVAEAKGCAAVTGAGLNAHTHSDGSATTSIVDAAFQEWVVTAAIKALPSVPAPKGDGEAVGTNVYSSYSQVVWSATSQVGCGFATCTAGKLVVCKYTSPGNTAGEPWYIHGSPNTQCPSGTEGKLGLCIVPGDAGNNDIAAIPAGQNSYEVFASFIGTMQKVLKGEAVDAGPATGTSASTNPGATTAPASASSAGGPMTGTSASTNPGATTAPAAASSAGGPMTGTSASTNPQSTAAAATTTAPTSDSTGATSTTTSAPAAATSGSAAAGASVSATATTGGSATDDEGKAAKSIGFGSLTSGSEGEPGTVRAGSNTGSTFTNEAKSSSKSSSTTTAAAAAAASTPQNAESTTSGGSGTANAKSSGEGDGDSHFSAAGVAGAIVVGCVMVAGIAVFVSYRKNQRRQRDIMQNGGIHIL